MNVDKICHALHDQPNEKEERRCKQSMLTRVPGHY